MKQSLGILSFAILVGCGASDNDDLFAPASGGTSGSSTASGGSGAATGGTGPSSGGSGALPGTGGLPGSGGAGATGGSGTGATGGGGTDATGGSSSGTGGVQPATGGSAGTEPGTGGTGGTEPGTGGTEPGTGGTSPGTGGNAGMAGSSATGGTGGMLACGNGVIDSGEECDDANKDNGDGCTNTCLVTCPTVRSGSVKNPDNAHCYWRHGTLMTWKEAVDLCASDGGHLVTIDSEEENEFLDQLQDDYFWIGATDGKADDDSIQGQYGWITGEPWLYESWGEGQPNEIVVPCAEGGGLCYEHCVDFASGEWNNLLCTMNRPAVCEWDPPGGATGGKAQ